MTNQLVIFIDILQSELEKLVIPDPSSEVARNTTVLAAKALRRLLVEEMDMPALRQTALAAYAALLPKLREVLDLGALAPLRQVLAMADSADWRPVEAALAGVMGALIARNDETARQLAGQLATIDARLREGREAAWAERSKPRPPRAGGKTARGGSEEEQARLLDFIQRHFPRETTLRIASIQQIPGGFSKHTLFINLEGNQELPDCIVMRRDGPFPGTSVTTEYPIIQKMFAAGVALPRPFAMDAAGEVYGKPFILVSRAAGGIIGDFVTVREPSREVALDLARKMARLHTAPFDGIEEYLVGGTAPITARLLKEIEACEADWKQVVHRQAYVVQAAFDWLKAHIGLAEGPRAVLHRDIGAHNMLIHDHQVSAFLDWETAAVGAPAEDLGYAYYTAVQMTEWPEFLAAYQAASGFQVNQRQLDYYILWASVRILVPILKNVDPVFGGGRKSLSDYYLGDHIGQVLIQRVATKLAAILA